jgi:hypothetical protein
MATVSGVPTLPCVSWRNFAHHVIPTLAGDQDVLLCVSESWGNMLGIAIRDPEVEVQCNGRKIDIGRAHTLRYINEKPQVTGTSAAELLGVASSVVSGWIKTLDTYGM